MPKPMIIALAAFGLTALHSMTLVPAAEAAIVCKDGFQNSNGNWISTPYCNDAHLAQIARNRGVKVSDSEVRRNPAKKYEICRFLGNVPPASDYCPDEGGDAHGR